MSRPAKGRGDASHVVALPGLWLDVDFCGDGHKKSNLPSGPDDAQRIFAAFGLAPSLLVHSGGGLQAYWIAPPRALISDADREDAHRITRRFHATALAICEQHGWTLDATHDLARVFRVPGTRNMKTGAPRPVDLLLPAAGFAPVAYEWSDLESCLILDADAVPTLPMERKPAVALISVAPSVGAPDWIEDACAADAKFRRTWDRKRRDLGDQSLSSYDMAIANTLVLGGFSDQQIADAIRAFRARHGTAADVAKASRRDYLQQTIAVARRNMDGHAAANSAEKSGGRLSGGIDDVSAMLGIDVSHLRKIGRANAMYSIVLKDGAHIHIGSAADLSMQSRVHQAIMDVACIKPRRQKGHIWDGILSCLLAHREEVDDPDGDPMLLLDDVLRDYLREIPPMDHDESPSNYFWAASEGRPLIAPDRRLMVHSPSFHRYAAAQSPDAEKPATVRRYLILRRFVREVVTFYDPLSDAPRITRAYYAQKTEDAPA
jgi:hypothetical protein